MTIIQLKYFQEAARCGSFSEASEILHVSQPGISRAIRELEEEYGAAIFTRSRNRVTLTISGQYLLDKSKPVLDAMQQLEKELEDNRSRNRPLRVAATAMILETLLGDTLTAVARQCPELKFSFVCADAESIRTSFKLSSTDVALLPLTKPLSENCRVVASRRHELMLCVSERHPMAGLESVEPYRLSDERFVYLSSNFFGDDGLRAIFSNVRSQTGYLAFPQLSQALVRVREDGCVLPLYRGAALGGGVVELSFSPPIFEELAIVRNIDRREMSEPGAAFADCVKQNSRIVD